MLQNIHTVCERDFAQRCRAVIKSSFCAKINLSSCVQIFWFPIGDELHSKRVERFRFSGVNLDNFEEWLFSVALSVDVTMRNEFDFPVELFFVDETYSNLYVYCTCCVL